MAVKDRFGFHLCVSSARFSFRGPHRLFPPFIFWGRSYPGSNATGMAPNLTWFRSLGTISSRRFPIPQYITPMLECGHESSYPPSALAPTHRYPAVATMPWRSAYLVATGRHDFLDRATNRTVNEVRGISCVVHDISSKPPGILE